MSNHFNVTLMSNVSINKYPKNVLSSFTNYIDCPLNLYGSWEVGISEIFYNDFTPVYKNVFNSNIIHDFQSMIDNEYVDTSKLDHNLIEDESLEKQQFTDFMYIHADIISPRIVGDQTVRCLKVMPAKAKLQEYVKFGRIEYYPVELFHIKSISITILDVESNRINFNHSSLPTMLTLHFKKINI